MLGKEIENGIRKVDRYLIPALLLRFYYIRASRLLSSLSSFPPLSLLFPSSFLNLFTRYWPPNVNGSLTFGGHMSIRLTREDFDSYFGIFTRHVLITHSHSGMEEGERGRRRERERRGDTTFFSSLILLYILRW